MTKHTFQCAVLLLSTAVAYEYTRAELTTKFEQLQAGLSVNSLTSRSHVRIAWIGESAMRNQLMFLCDLLAAPYDKNLFGAQYFFAGCKSPDGRVEIIGHAVGGTQPPWDMRTAGELYDQLANRSLVGREGAAFDATYFCSMIFHAMALGHDKGFQGRPGLDLAADVAEAATQLRARGSCPIFSTANWICDRKFTGSWASTVALARASGNATAFYEARCREQRGVAAGDVPACGGLSFTSEGADYAARLEHEGLAMLREPVALVDSHAMTRHQCWATKDGRHYTPLLPQRLAALIDGLDECFGNSDAPRGPARSNRGLRGWRLGARAARASLQ